MMPNCLAVKKNTLNPLKNPLIVALDVDQESTALKLADDLQSVAGAFKLGPRLCYRYGEKFIKKVAERGPVFVDNKYFDIPNTMEAAVRASFEAGASLVTVHALAGLEALERLARLEAELQKERPFVILNVTILTSWNENSFPANFRSQTVHEHVKSLTDLVRQSGLTGLVCAGQELAAINAEGMFVVVPGIRSQEDSLGDQKRVVTAGDAIQAGAKGLVVGRPIIEAANPVEKAQQFLNEIKSIKGSL